MFNELLDGITFGASMLFSIVLWVVGVVVWGYSYVGRNDYIDWMPQSVINTLLAIWLFIGSLPILNYTADKEQYGSVLGAARDLDIFSERPWYGMGGYQFLIGLLIAAIGFGYTWYNRRRY